MQKIGFIGLGIMGKPMAKNLLKAEYSVMAFNRSQAAVDEVCAAGAERAQSVAQLAAQCGIIITMLPNSPQVEQIALGEGGIAENAKPGTLLVDMSSIAPAATQKIGAALAQKGIHMLDAPVSGGEPKAIEGTLAIMAGGREEDFAAAQPLFNVLGASACLVGALGSGNTCKLANQIIVAGNIAALCEGLTLAQKAGANPQKVYEAIRGGLAGSTVMDAKTPMILSGNTAPGFKIELHVKDLANALDTGAAYGSPLPITAEVQQMFRLLCANGDNASDHSALSHYYEMLAQTDLSAAKE